MNVPLDKVVGKVVALGVPGLVLVVVMGISGLAGAAAITTGLATLGGPLGMLGGLVLLGLLVLVSDAVGRYGQEIVINRVIQGLSEKGLSHEEIIEKMDTYWFLSESLKLKMKEIVERHFRKRDAEGEAGVGAV